MCPIAKEFELFTTLRAHSLLFPIIMSVLRNKVEIYDFLIHSGDAIRILKICYKGIILNLKSHFCVKMCFGQHLSSNNLPCPMLVCVKPCSYKE